MTDYRKTNEWYAPCRDSDLVMPQLLGRSGDFDIFAFLSVIMVARGVICEERYPNGRCATDASALKVYYRARDRR